jgi:transmembrane sensor
MERPNLPESDWDRILKHVDSDSPYDESFTWWIEQSHVREALYEELLLIQKSASLTLFADSGYKRKVWQSVLNKIKEQEQVKRLKKRTQYLRVAAVILPFIFLSAGFWIGSKFTRSSDEQYSRYLNDCVSSIEPGSKKAKLILADGTTVDLSKNVSLKESDGTAIENNSDNELCYNGASSHSAGKINTLVVPKGGEYQLRLSDGTKVWLNSGSTLRYPTVFDSKRRAVTLEGEAYFEVTKNKHLPFSVNVKGLDLVVLGTTFNVNAYNPAKGISTTLVEGKISMEMGGGKRYTIKPLENITYNFESETYTIEKNVDVSLFTSWKDGLFWFENKSLGEITDRLSRWYSCEIVYKDESLRNMKFTGLAEKKRPIEYLLDLISEIKDVDYEVKNGIVFIAKRKVVQ